MTKLKASAAVAVSIAALFALLLLSGCGGGGPDSATAEGNPSSSEVIVKSNDKVKLLTVRQTAFPKADAASGKASLETVKSVDVANTATWKVGCCFLKMFCCF